MIWYTGTYKYDMFILVYTGISRVVPIQLFSSNYHCFIVVIPDVRTRYRDILDIPISLRVFKFPDIGSYGPDSDTSMMSRYRV
jgi:hypothetical protein